MSKEVKKQPTTGSISDQVLDQIKEGQVHMHADWYFALLSTGFAIALAFVLVTGIYALNLALLRFEIAHSDVRPWLLGRYYFEVNHLPLGFLLIAALSVAGVSYLLRHRSHYTRNLPEWSVVLGVIVFIGCLSFVMSRSSINRDLRHNGPFRPLYEEQQPMRPRPAPFNERNEQPTL